MTLMFGVDHYKFYTHAVLMQAMKEEPPLGVKSKDKFLVQACAVQADGATVDGWTAAAGDLWAEADRVRVGEVESFKLTVLYVDASSVGGSATVPPAVVPPQLPSVAPPVAAPAPVSSTASPQSQATVARPASTNSFGSPAAAQNSSPLAQSTTASPTPVTKAYGVAPSASVAAPPVAAAAPPKVSFASSGSQASLAVAPVDLPAIPADSQLVPKKQLQETKDELARLQELCDKYQRV